MLDERDVEELLRGGSTTTRDEGLVALAGVMSVLRDEAEVAPQPDAALRQVFSEGAGSLATDAAPVAVPPAPGGPAQGTGGLGAAWRRVLARGAALSLAAKLALAGAAVAGTALGGAGAAGLLPGQSEAPSPTDPSDGPSQPADPGPDGSEPDADAGGQDLDPRTSAPPEGAPGRSGTELGPVAPQPHPLPEGVRRPVDELIGSARGVADEDGDVDGPEADDVPGDAVDDATGHLDEELPDDPVEEGDDLLDAVPDDGVDGDVDDTEDAEPEEADPEEADPSGDTSLTDEIEDELDPEDDGEPTDEVEDELEDDLEGEDGLLP